MLTDSRDQSSLWVFQDPGFQQCWGKNEAPIDLTAEDNYLVRKNLPRNLELTT